MNPQLTFVCSWFLAYLLINFIGRGVYMGLHRVEREQVNEKIVSLYSASISFAIIWLSF